MNNTDLMDALSGIDSSFIDEAAYELHGSTETKEETSNITDIKKARSRRTARILYITVPAAAAIILMVCVALPAILRINRNSATAESANYAPAAEAPAAADAADSAPMEEAEEAMTESAKDVAEEPIAQAEVAEAENEVMAEEAAPSDEDSIAMAVPSEPMAEEATSGSGTVPFLLGKATYENGTLLIDAKGTIPENIEDLAYSIVSKDEKTDKSSETNGTVGEILPKDNDEAVEDGRLKLDISVLKLSPGSYTITIGNSSTDFKVK